MDNDAVHKGTAIFSLDLHPAYSNKAKEGVHLQLQSRLMRWDNDLDGLLLAYDNLQKLPTQAEIRPYFPYLQLKVKADVLVFRPKIGQILCGQVNKMGADYIGMTVLGAVNAAVGRQNIHRDLQYDHQSGNWKCLSDQHGDITDSSDVLFAVDRLRIEPSGVLAVMGCMREPWSGSAQAAAIKLPSAFPEAEKWRVKRLIPKEPLGDASLSDVRQGESADEERETPQKSVAGIMDPLTTKKKSKKRKRTADESGGSDPMDPGHAPSTPEANRGKSSEDQLGSEETITPQETNGPALAPDTAGGPATNPPKKKKRKKAKAGGPLTEELAVQANPADQTPAKLAAGLGSKEKKHKKKSAKQKDVSNPALPNGTAHLSPVTGDVQRNSITT